MEKELKDVLQVIDTTLWRRWFIYTNGNPNDSSFASQLGNLTEILTEKARYALVKMGRRKLLQFTVELYARAQRTLDFENSGYNDYVYGVKYLYL